MFEQLIKDRESGKMSREEFEKNILQLACVAGAMRIEEGLDSVVTMRIDHPSGTYELTTRKVK